MKRGPRSTPKITMRRHVKRERRPSPAPRATRHRPTRGENHRRSGELRCAVTGEVIGDKDPRVKIDGLGGNVWWVHEHAFKQRVLGACPSLVSVDGIIESTPDSPTRIVTILHLDVVVDQLEVNFVLKNLVRCFRAPVREHIRTCLIRLGQAVRHLGFTARAADRKSKRRNKGGGLRTSYRNLNELIGIP